MYWKRTGTTSDASLDNFGGNNPTAFQQAEFYEIEPAVVLDVILDSTHPKLKNNLIDLDVWPPSINGKKPSEQDIDLSWVGRVQIRLLHSNRSVEKEELVWALPLESNVTEYPVVNEVVGVIRHLEKFFYTRKINLNNFPNNNVDFQVELNNGGYVDPSSNQQKGNRETIEGDIKRNSYVDFIGPESRTRVDGGPGFNGAAGRYFILNHRIRSLKRREGDLIVESRFGQSIRFGAYDDNRLNDRGHDDNFSGYADYKGSGLKYKNIDGKIYEAGGGNPMILIRNRQRPLTEPGKSTRVYENVPPVMGTIEEKNVGGYVSEDINNDGSSIHITSGTTISGFVTNCLKKMWGNGSEEQGVFNGPTKFTYPILNGDQIVLNSDRVIVSSKRGETFHFSKKRYAVVTDDEYTVDAHNQIILTTNTKTVINSPVIYLGSPDVTDEPALLGQTTVNWLYDLCDWLIKHTHWYKHKHPDAGQAKPDKTQTPVEVAKLIVMREKLETLLSRRVFITGGGFAPGADGGNIPTLNAPTKINVSSGTGVPGGWKGRSKR